MRSFRGSHDLAEFHPNGVEWMTRKVIKTQTFDVGTVFERLGVDIWATGFRPSTRAYQTIFKDQGKACLRGC